MNCSFLLILVLLSISNVQSQSFEGVYEDGFERLEFHSDTVYYLIGTNGGLIYPIVGYGAYELIDSFLIIENQDSSEVFRKLKLNLNDFYSDLRYMIYADKDYTAFKVSQMAHCYVECILLSYDFDWRKDSRNSLRKLYRKQNKNPYVRGRDRIYRKAECY